MILLDSNNSRIYYWFNIRTFSFLEASMNTFAPFTCLFLELLSITVANVWLTPLRKIFWFSVVSIFISLFSLRNCFWLISKISWLILGLMPPRPRVLRLYKFYCYYYIFSALLAETWLKVTFPMWTFVISELSLSPPYTSVAVGHLFNLTYYCEEEDAPIPLVLCFIGCTHGPCKYPRYSRWA